MIIKSLTIFIFYFVLGQSAFATHKIYIIHGFGGYAHQMERINKSLKQSGYLTENYAYRSFSEDLDSVGLNLYRKIKNENYDSVSFVTHSMGALVVRSIYKYIDSTSKFPIVFRCVMLAPPNKGTYISNWFSGRFFKFFFGPNVENMRTDANSTANKLPLPNCEVGIIAGIRGKKPYCNPMIAEDNDGRITLKQASLGIEKEFAIVKSEHALMPLKAVVVEMTINFIQHGSFKNNQ